ncbi:MAG: esterase/lipase family protein, partial [Planctomycetota bacterium]
MKKTTLLLLVALGCSDSIGIRRSDDETYVERHRRTALESDEAGEYTRHALRHLGLEDRWDEEPEGALLEIHRVAVNELRRELAIPLAELSYVHARRQKPESSESLRFYLSAAEYAYAFLFDEGLGEPASPYDRSFRDACDFYNVGMGKIVAHVAKHRLMRDGVVTLPRLAGQLQIREGHYEMGWNPEEFEEVLVTYEFEIEGLRQRAAASGVGVPCIAVRRPPKIRTDDERFLPPMRLSYAATVIVRFEGSLVDRAPSRQASAEIYDSLRRTEFRVGNRTVPLEIDLSTPVAHTMGNMRDYSGFKAMLRVEEWSDQAGLYMLVPYQPDRIPVVFVHGLMSSPKTWVPLLTNLLSDPLLRKRYQPWVFLYPTGNPIVYSAAILRKALQEVQEAYDPEGNSPHFRRMVVCGHSMGGLLTRMLVQDGGDRLWEAVTDDPLDSLEVTAEQRELLRSCFYFPRLPYIERVIFMATPHRGSDIASGFVGSFGSSLVSLPKEVTDTARKVPPKWGADEDTGDIEASITGIANLSPDHPVQKTIASWPYPPDLKIHSILGNKDVADRKGGSDGVVAYQSAHLD